MGVSRLADLPAEWSRQHQLLGLPAQIITQSNRVSSNQSVEAALGARPAHLSLLPGNGILPAETKAPKRLRKTKETIAKI